MWEEDQQQDSLRDSEIVQDISFKINCPTLPLDHGHLLSEAIQQALPWLADLPNAGLHLIHGAASGNGWDRPEDQSALLHLSRRTRLSLRIPNTHLEQAKTLIGQTLQLGEYQLNIGGERLKPLSVNDVLFVRYLVADEQQSEADFIQQTLQQLQAQGIYCRKAMPGRTHHFDYPDSRYFTRSLMLADLSPQDSIRVQEQGLGAHQHLGFGLFIHHKGIRPVGEEQS